MTPTTSKKSAVELINEAIAELEAKLGLHPGQSISRRDAVHKDTPTNETKASRARKQDKKQQQQPKRESTTKEADVHQPGICKLEFKVGQITKVWIHPDAEKLYCEEIDVGEAEPRQIASGLRAHYTEEQMLGQRLLVVSNLKPKSLVGFKSFGMVLCAVEPKEDGTEKVEFIEPPEGAEIGEVVTFEGLPPPSPLTAAQVEKKKVFQSCMEGMMTTEDGVAAWNGHAFLTSAGPCRSKTISGGVMR